MGVLAGGFSGEAGGVLGVKFVSLESLARGGAKGGDTWEDTSERA